LQCVAVCRVTLTRMRCVAVYITHQDAMHRRVAVCCSALQCYSVAVCCSVAVLQCCSVLQSAESRARALSPFTDLGDFESVEVCCSVLQCMLSLFTDLRDLCSGAICWVAEDALNFCIRSLMTILKTQLYRHCIQKIEWYADFENFSPKKLAISAFAAWWTSSKVSVLLS